jgi:hypothetical protein
MAEMYLWRCPFDRNLFGFVVMTSARKLCFFLHGQFGKYELKPNSFCWDLKFVERDCDVDVSVWLAMHGCRCVVRLVGEYDAADQKGIFCQ